MIYQEKRDTELVKGLLEKYTEIGQIPLAEVHELLKVKKNLPPRTFQWYVKEGLLLPPDAEGRNSYYKINDFLKVIQLVFIIQQIKDVSRVKFSSLRNILRIHKNNLRPIIDAILNLIEQYPVNEWDEEMHHTTFNYEHSLIWQQVFIKLENGSDPESFLVTDIQEELEREKLPKKK